MTNPETLIAKPRAGIAIVCPTLEYKVSALATLFIPILGTITAIIAIFNGWVPGSIEIILLVSLFTFSMIGIEIGCHRYFSHHSFQAHRFIKALLAISASTAGQGPPIFWVAHHRRHHQYCDLKGDAHSPHAHGSGWLNRLRGIWHAYFGWMLSMELTNTVLFAKDLLRDSFLCRLNQLYLLWFVLGLIIPAVIDGVIAGTWAGLGLGLLWGGLVRVFLVQHTTNLLNTTCHLFGTRPFQSDDHSTNNFWLAIPTLGEAWHNNHHAFPNSAITGLYWWQIDLSGIIIRIFEKTGLVWDVKKPTPEMIEAKAR